MKIPNLVYSTIVLFISNLIVRVLGFFYKIFLSNNIPEVQLGIYHLVFHFLMICIAITTTGIPTSLSCLIAHKKTSTNNNSSTTYFVSALYLAFIISIVISLFVGFNNKYIASTVLHNSNLYIFVLAICPAIVVITLSNILRGYYYGIKKVNAPAISQILEQLVKILFVYLVVKNTNNPLTISLSAIIGISISECASLIFMTFNLSFYHNFSNRYTLDIKEFIYSSYETIKMALPITCNRMSSIILNSVSSMIIPSRLVLSGMTYHSALGVYGVISGMVSPFIFLPFMLVSALVVNLIPSISIEVGKKNYVGIRRKVYYSFSLTLVMGLLCSIIFYFFGETICLYIFNSKSAGIYLKYMCLVPLFMGLNHIISAILHAIGKEYLSSGIGIVSILVQTIVLYFTISIPQLNIYAYIITLTIIPMLTFIINIYVLYKYLKSIM
ncbi:MAG: oligosaccharide flippase family protein [Paraclostridium sp.]